MTPKRSAVAEPIPANLPSAPLFTENRGDAALRWQRERRVLGSELAPIRSWLLDDGSLTQRLLDTGREFSLDRLSQCWQKPLEDERLALEIPPREKALVREVVLKLDDEPMVFARSVFPVSSLTGPLLRLRRLAGQSLGAFLFARKDMRRSPFAIARISAGSMYLPPALTQSEPIWARRSCFQVAGKPILVAEAFLAGFPTWQAPTPLHRSRRGRVSATIGSTRS